MTNESAYCSRCGWHGEDHIAFSRSERLEILEHLEPGDIVPSGVCPDCGGVVHPNTILIEPLNSIETYLDEDVDHTSQWQTTVSRVGGSYVLHFVHPGGYGAEIIAEISGERPSLQISTFNSEEELNEAEPIAFAKVGEDHVVITNNSDAFPTSVIVTEDNMRSKILGMNEWSELKDWSERP